MRRQSQEESARQREEEERRRVSQQRHQRQEVLAHQAQQQRASLDDESPTTVTNELHQRTEQSREFNIPLPLQHHITPHEADEINTSFELNTKDGRSQGRDHTNNNRTVNLSPPRKMKPRLNICRDGGGGFVDTSQSSDETFAGESNQLAGESDGDDDEAASTVTAATATAVVDDDGRRMNATTT